eukprot:378473-Hanusia_phi.AAC.1
MVVKTLLPNLIDAEILTGCGAGERVTVHPQKEDPVPSQARFRDDHQQESGADVQYAGICARAALRRLLTVKSGQPQESLCACMNRRSDEERGVQTVYGPPDSDLRKLARGGGNSPALQRQFESFRIFISKSGA